MCYKTVTTDTNKTAEEWRQHIIESRIKIEGGYDDTENLTDIIRQIQNQAREQELQRVIFLLEHPIYQIKEGCRTKKHICPKLHIEAIKDLYPMELETPTPKCLHCNR